MNPQNGRKKTTLDFASVLSEGHAVLGKSLTAALKKGTSALEEIDTLAGVAAEHLVKKGKLAAERVKKYKLSI